MALSVLSNFAANVAHRNLSANDAMVTSSLAKLSSGSRVVSAKDDAAALAIGSRLTAEVAGLKQASVNAGQAVSMLQIADGALGKVSDILVRMKSLSVQAGSDQLSSTERGFLNTEYTQLRTEIDRIAADTEFNGNKLLNGSSTVAVSAVGTNIEVADGIVGLSFGGSHGVSTAGDTYTIAYDTGTDRFTVSQGSTTALSEVVAAAPAAGMTQDVYISEFDLTITVGSNFAPTTAIAANNTFTATASAANTVSFGFKIGTGNVAAEDEISITLSQSTTAALGSATTTTFATGDVTTKGNADQASADVGAVINKVNEYRATIGANQNRLEFAAANLATATENTEAARSALLDLDVAAEMTEFTSKQILMQAGVSMLAQAN
ncbi:MAG: flagellin, partial [Rhodospirillaceae bacterium]|nr:flagellin [Rhodospirillaceae bacterium]